MDDVNYYEMGSEELFKEVNEGNFEAIYQLGSRYKLGDRIEQNISKAIELFTKVYKETNNQQTKLYAAAELGEIYLKAENYKNLDLAIGFLKEGCEGNNPFARQIYGYYLIGAVENFEIEKTKEQEKEGFELLKRLFEETNDGETAYYLAIAYADGRGCDVDYDKAEQCVKYAIEQQIEGSKEIFELIQQNKKTKERQIEMVDIKKSELILNESKLAQVLSVKFTDGSTLESLMNLLINSSKSNNIPCEAEYIQLKTGNILKSSLEPACIVYHPEHRNDYFFYVFVYKQQGNMGCLYIYKGGNSTQISKENFNQNMKNSGGGLLTKTISLAARGVNAIGKDKSKLQDEQLYYASFEQNLSQAFQLRKD